MSGDGLMAYVVFSYSVFSIQSMMVTMLVLQLLLAACDKPPTTYL